MTVPDFPEDLVRFIQRSLPTYSAAEVLICVAHDPGRTWTVDELLAAVPGLAPEVAADYLLHFLRAELLSVESENHYRYDPRTEDDRIAVAMLTEAYEHRPVTLIRTIYALETTKIQSFADSFKLKRD